MKRRRFLLLAGSATGLGATSGVASVSSGSADHPKISDSVLSDHNWSQLRQYSRTSDEDKGEDTGGSDIDIGVPDRWHITEFSDDDLGSAVEDGTESTIQAPLSYLWTLRVDPSRLTKLGWDVSAKFGEIGEVAVGIDSDVLDEFEEQASNQLPEETEFYPPNPINMRVVRAAGEAITSKLPGGSFVDEAKTWIKGPCSGLVTTSGEGVFYEKYWIRRRVDEDELMECKGIYADWVHNSEFRAVAGVVPWSWDHVEGTVENIGYELTLEEKEKETEDELKHLMANVEF